MSDAIHYELTPADPHGHQFKITMTIPMPNSDGHRVRLPSWIPGSYLIRDFAKNITSISAVENNVPLTMEKLDKSQWQLPPNQAPITLEYWVYAWDMSVRSAHFDQTHAYFNGTSVFLEAVGHHQTSCELSLHNCTLPTSTNWRVATSLAAKAVDSQGFGLYRAEDYEDLIDHPVEIGDFDRVHFNAASVPHELIISGRHNGDLNRVAKDLAKICDYQIQFFGAPAPFSRYLFLTQVVGNGYGGLEHRSSTSLLCNRDDLPSAKQSNVVSEGYRNFLGLCSHEYFHSWNVKRIQPDIPYDLSRENYTPLLWAFEGITSYYDNLILVRTGLISRQDYLNLVAKDLTRIMRNPGRLLQSTAESSFEAWTKFYQQKENAPNAIVSYYTKGSLVALCLDLMLRKLSSQQLSLDQIMLLLWQQHGQTGQPVAEQTIQILCRQQLAQCTDDQNLMAELDQYLENSIYGTEDWDIASLMQPFGVTMVQRCAADDNDQGGNLKTGNEQRIDLGLTAAKHPVGAKVARVRAYSSSHEAGISAGDIIIAVNGIKADNNNLTTLVDRYQAGDSIDISLFRRDELMTMQLKLQLATPDTVDLTITDDKKLDLWLNPL